MLGKTTSTWITDRRATARRKILDAAWTVAREQGVAALTLREVADRVGIRAPSLYSHFDSKHAIYDAMFGESWQELLDVNRAADSEVATGGPSGHGPHLLRLRHRRPGPPPADGRAHHPGLHAERAELRAGDNRPGRGDPADGGPRIRVDAADIDLYTAVIAGLVNQQWANDPGGSRWGRLLERAIDMYADNIGLPREDS